MAITTFVLDSDGCIERAAPNTGRVLFGKLTGSPPVESQQVFIGDLATVEANAPVWARVKGCIDPTTNLLELELEGRTTILSCNSALYLSRGEVGRGCVLAVPVTVDPPASP